MRKLTAIAAYAIFAASMILFRDAILEWLRSDTGSWQSEAVVLAAAFLIAFVPAIPYAVVAAAFGAKYGVWIGGIINLAVSLSAAVALFGLVRYVFTPEQRKKAATMKGMARLTGLFERSPFAAVLTARLLPVVPAQAVNVYASLTRMGVIPYAAATAIGKIPFLLSVTLLGDQLFRSPDWTSITAVITAYGAVLFVAGWRYRRSYRQ